MNGTCSNACFYPSLSIHTPLQGYGGPIASEWHHSAAYDRASLFSAVREKRQQQSKTRSNRNKNSFWIEISKPDIKAKLPVWRVLGVWDISVSIRGRQRYCTGFDQLRRDGCDGGKLRKILADFSVEWISVSEPNSIVLGLLRFRRRNCSCGAELLRK